MEINGNLCESLLTAEPIFGKESLMSQGRFFHSLEAGFSQANIMSIIHKLCRFSVCVILFKTWRPIFALLWNWVTDICRKALLTRAFKGRRYEDSHAAVGVWKWKQPFRAAVFLTAEKAGAREPPNSDYCCLWQHAALKKAPFCSYGADLLQKRGQSLSKQIRSCCEQPCSWTSCWLVVLSVCWQLPLFCCI